jgi:hypothetical protein
MNYIKRTITPLERPFFEIFDLKTRFSSKTPQNKKEIQFLK